MWDGLQTLYLFADSAHVFRIAFTRFQTLLVPDVLFFRWHPVPLFCSCIINVACLMHKNLFNGLFSRTTWVSQYQKGKTSLDLNEARDGGFWNVVASAGPYAIFTLLQTDNRANTPSLNFYRSDALRGCPTNSVNALKANFLNSNYTETPNYVCDVC